MLNHIPSLMNGLSKALQDPDFNFSAGMIDATLKLFRLFNNESKLCMKGISAYLPKFKYFLNFVTVKTILVNSNISKEVYKLSDTGEESSGK